VCDVRARTHRTVWGVPWRGGTRVSNVCDTVPEPGAPDVTVLTVDDQAIFLRTVRRLLAATHGFVHVGEASSGEQAVGLAADLRPDLALVDVRMPGMDGIETARRMHEATPGAAIVLISVEEIPDGAIRTPGVIACLRKQELSGRTLRTLWATHGAAASQP
jgi:CheY-like chemotaxis protein